MLSLQSLPLNSISPSPNLGDMTPHLQEAHDASLRSKVTVVGSGSWGSVAAKLIASNTLRFTSFHDEVRMWVFEQTLPSGEKLTDAINGANENVKYLPGIKLGKNVVADPDLENAVKDANMLVFVTPHQFVEGICRRVVGKIKTDAQAISLVKGMEVKVDGPRMMSTLISQQLGINCSVLMGANIANEIGQEKFSETGRIGRLQRHGFSCLTLPISMWRPSKMLKGSSCVELLKILWP